MLADFQELLLAYGTWSHEMLHMWEEILRHLDTRA